VDNGRGPSPLALFYDIMPGSANDIDVRVVRRLPATPTLANVRPLLRPATAQSNCNDQQEQMRSLNCAYLLPRSLAGLLDVLGDDTDVDAQAHLDALNVHPSWRAGPRSTDEAAVRSLVTKLRSISQPVVLVLLFGSPPPRRQQRLPTHPVDTLATKKASIHAELRRGRLTPQVRPPSNMAETSLTEATSHVEEDPSSFVNVARPCILNQRPHSARRLSRSTTPAASAAPIALEEDAAANAAANEVAAQAAGWAMRFAGGGTAMPSLRSRHDLPTEGNWVRLSAQQQHAVTREAATERRRAAAGLGSAQVGACNFGSEPRLSTSRRWAHQTTSGRATSGARCAAAQVREEGAAPGSFLPLKACASVLQPRRASQPVQKSADAAMVTYPSLGEESVELEVEHII